MKKLDFPLRVKRVDIDTGREGIAFINKYCPVVVAHGLEGMNRVRIFIDEEKWVIATINVVNSPVVYPEEIILSNKIMEKLSIKEGDMVRISHMEVLTSFSYVRSKMYGNELDEKEFLAIMQDITKGRYSSVQISSFLTACCGDNLNEEEIVGLTKSMVEVGERIDWSESIVVDKHCIGGVPGNRTTPIVVAIASAFGLTIPKTSSRAITSPAGTADTMEVFTNVDLSFAKMKEVVKKEKGCLVWGGGTPLSPADDILIKVEYDLDIDSNGQMIASVMSKKIAAGATHTVIDIPVGPTAKARTKKDAETLKKLFEYVAEKLNIKSKVILTDGTQPIGNGVGPALEAKDVELVLKNDPEAPQDLREKAIMLAGLILEYSPSVKAGTGKAEAKKILDSGKAWDKFRSICLAQGAIKEIPQANYIYSVKAQRTGVVSEIDNRKLSQLAKMAGAPIAKAAGVYLNKHLKDKVKKGDVLYSIHAEAEGELNYALKLLNEFEIVKIK